MRAKWKDHGHVFLNFGSPCRNLKRVQLFGNNFAVLLGFVCATHGNEKKFYETEITDETVANTLPNRGQLAPLLWNRSPSNPNTGSYIASETVPKSRHFAVTVRKHFAWSNALTRVNMCAVEG